MKHHTTRIAALLAALTLCAAGAWAAMPDAEFVNLCAEGTVAQVKQALKNGANPNARDSEHPLNWGDTDYTGWTALMWAVERKDETLVRTLLSAGADVNAASRRPADLKPEDFPSLELGETPLMVAAEKGFLSLVQTLLAAGAEVNARDDSGYTALHSAAVAGRAKTVAALLKAGADVNAQGNNGMSALMLAARNGKPLVSSALLKAGANPKLKDKEGHDALWHARAPEMAADVSEADRAETVRLLQGNAQKKP
ncbi:MAG: ankyrin repeat domain-containing protein [Ottowia sp.]|nr:ankyrin repeat domain-containing protein [Ottowia sp.]